MLDLYAKFALLRSLVGGRLGHEDGGAVIEYAVVVSVIALGFLTVGVALVGAVGEWFADLAAYASTLGAPESS